MFNNTFIHHANKVHVSQQRHKDENGKMIPKIKIEIYGTYKDLTFIQEFTVFSDESDEQIELLVNNVPVMENLNDLFH